MVGKFCKVYRHSQYVQKMHILIGIKDKKMSVRLITRLIVNGKFLPVIGSLFFNKIAPALLIPAYIFFVPMSAHQKMQDGLKGLFELAQSSAQLANNYFTNIAPDMKQEFSLLATNNSEKINNNFRQKFGIM
jgi:hypothetical protein